MNLEVDKYNDSDYLIDREEYIEGLDKEEKIIILEKFLKEMDHIFQKTKINNTKERNALRELISEYKQQEQKYLDEVDKHVDIVLLYNRLLNKIKSYDKELENARKINEEHQKINGELREKVRKLEKENSTLKNFTSDLFNEDITQTFICKDKIKDKIEELKQAFENTNKDRWKTVYTVQIEILQRLLQEEDK